MSRLTRRHFGRVLTLVFAGGALPAAQARDTALPVPSSLRDAASRAAAQNEPLVLLMSLPGCPYCELVRRNYLLPMRAEGLHVWQIDVNDRRTVIRDLADQPSSGDQLAARWKASFTPTVLFLDGKGTEIAGRLKGVASPDFYGAYLDQALVAARQHLARQPSR